MNKSRSRILSLLAVALVIGGIITGAPPLTTTALAATGRLNLDGNTEVNDLSKSDDGAGWAWDAPTATLTLSEHYDRGRIVIDCALGEDINLKYSGNVKVTNTGEGEAILCRGNLTITRDGSGTLTTSSTKSAGITVLGKLTITGDASVIVQDGSESTSGMIDCVSGIEISGNASVTATRSTEGRGISVQNGGITIDTTGTVTANGVGNHYALYAEGASKEIVIQSGTVNLSGANLIQGDLTITGGILTYNGGTPPTMTSLMPNEGPMVGGTKVTIAGTGFVEGSTSVKIGGAAATNVTVNSATELTCTTPMGTLGAADVQVETTDGATGHANSFTYTAPVIKTVAVGTQNGALTAGTAGSVTYSVTTANINDGSYPATVANLPTGVTVQGNVAISSNSGTLTLAGDTTTVAGATSDLTLTLDSTISGNFRLTVQAAQQPNTYALNVSAGAGGHVSGTPSASYAPGTAISVTAVPDSGYVFDGWTVTGITPGNGAALSFTMPANAVTLTANFQQVGDEPYAFPSALNITIGDTADFTVYLGQNAGTADSATVTSNDPATASVSENEITASGTVITVTGVSAGSTTISLGWSGGTMDNQSTSINVEVHDAPPVGNYFDLTIVGSYASDSGAGSYMENTKVTIQAGSRSGYTFTGWIVGETYRNHIADATSPTTTFQMPAGDITITANWSYNGGSSSGSNRNSGSSGGGSSGTDYTATAVNTPVTVTTATATSAAKSAAAAANASGASTATVRIKNPGKVSLAAMQAMAKEAGMPVKFQADSTSADGKSVEVRITLDPAKATEDLNLSASTTNAIAKARKAFFEKWFRNDISVVSFVQQGSFGQPVEVAVKIDLAVDVKNLVFYSYDKATNNYKRIENPGAWVDKISYLHFTTELAGDIIISVGPLEKK